MKTKLTEISDEIRPTQLVKNIYRGGDGSNQYSDRHPNALADVHGADDPQNNKGKGVTQGDPYAGGGGNADIHGNGIDMASGRNGNLVKNHYSPSNPYPYTSIE